jgi:hypothetical protein
MKELVNKTILNLEKIRDFLIEEEPDNEENEKVESIQSIIDLLDELFDCD